LIEILFLRVIDSLTSFVDPIVGNEDGAKECTDGELVDNEEIVSIDHTDRDMMCPYLPLPDTYYDLMSDEPVVGVGVEPELGLVDDFTCGFVDDFTCGAANMSEEHSNDASFSGLFFSSGGCTADQNEEKIKDN
jgi:hypothetical protein